MYQHDDAFVAWGNETLSSSLYINPPPISENKDEEIA
jgi:hypothetical protein